MMRNFVKNNLIFMTLAGSHMYGTNIPGSDIDKRGVCVPPINTMLGFANKFEQQEYPNEDTTVFGLQKFMSLASQCNPNIIELLFAPEDSIITMTPTWEYILAHRDKFLSAKAYHTFTGYAISQLKRIKTHRNWLLNPPSHQPTRQEFGLSESAHGTRELARGIDVTKVDPNIIKVIEKEKRYKAALTQWNQHQTWKKNRNPKRAALEADYGYDTKHAMHLVRLLRMGKEILIKGTLTVRRDDASELLDIRNGIWTYDQLMENIEPLQDELERIYNNKEYVVPHKPDINVLSDLCAEAHLFFWTNTLLTRRTNLGTLSFG